MRLALPAETLLLLPNLPLRHPVADARLGEDVGGVVRLVSQLAAEVLRCGTHRPQIREVSRPRDISL